jgi:hypothetical protein
MKYRKIFLSTSVFVLSFLVLACGQQKDKWQGTIEEVGGITTINNPETPLFSGEPLTLVEDLIIHASGENDEYQFGEIYGISTDNDGNIYTLDGKESKILVFDKEGVFKHHIGRKGDGPGELSFPTGIQIASDGGIVITCTTKLVYYSLSGDYIKQIKHRLFDVSPKIDSSGNVISMVMFPGKERGSFITALQIFNSDLALISNLAELRGSMDPEDRKLSLFPRRIHYTILPSDDIAWGFNDEYKLNIVRTDGAINKRIIKKGSSIILTEERKNEILQTRNRPGVVWDIPKYFPFFHHLLSDELGNIYVSTYKRDPAGFRYVDVFNSDGKYMYEIKLKNEPRLIRKGHIYCIAEEESGLHYVVRLKMNFPAARNEGD